MELQQQAQLNNDLESAGFAYDLRGDYFYSLLTHPEKQNTFLYLEM